MICVDGFDRSNFTRETRQNFVKQGQSGLRLQICNLAVSKLTPCNSDNAAKLNDLFRVTAARSVF